MCYEPGRAATVLLLPGPRKESRPRDLGFRLLFDSVLC